jgi:hypothetical protein
MRKVMLAFFMRIGLSISLSLEHPQILAMFQSCPEASESTCMSRENVARNFPELYEKKIEREFPPISQPGNKTVPTAVVSKDMQQ